MTIVDEQQQPTPPKLETLQKKIDEFANGIRGIQDIFLDRKKTIIRQMDEIRQLASDLNVDSIQLRKMILESFADIDVSESWLRKLLPETLKLKAYQKRLSQITTATRSTTITSTTRAATKGIGRIIIIIVLTSNSRTTTTR